MISSPRNFIGPIPNITIDGQQITTVFKSQMPWNHNRQQTIME